MVEGGFPQSSIKCGTAGPAVLDSDGPSSIIKGPNIRSFVAKSVLSRFTRFLGVRVAKNVVAKMGKYGIFVATFCKYALIDSFQGYAAVIDSSANCAALRHQVPESGCIVGGAAAASRPESARGVDEAAKHQLAGDERKQCDENFLQRRKLNGNKSKTLDKNPMLARFWTI